MSTSILSESSNALQAPADAGAAGETEARPVTIIRPPRGWQFVDIAELWRFRELIGFLTWRDVKVRYKQTFLGAAWAILQPLMMMVVFSIFFRRMAGMSSGDVPYPVFVFAGLLPWTFFSNAINAGSQSVIGNQKLVTKVYFPRLSIPIGAIGAGLVDFAVSFFMLLVVMGYYGIMPGWTFLYLPALVVLVCLTSLGMGMLLAALTVAYRDFRYVVPFMIQLWMFATPSIYMDASGLPESRWKHVLALNPLNGLIDGFRAALLGQPFDGGSLLTAALISFLFLAVGCLYFRKVETTFADII
jgi:lipopolysaccharide transport system permease protein